MPEPAIDVGSRAETASRGTPESAYAWTRLFAALLLSAIGGVGMWSVIVALPAVQAEFGVARSAASLPYTVTMICFGFGGILMGRLTDRFGIVAPVVGGTILLVRSEMERSMMSATAMIEAASSGQIGQPAAWMIANNSFPRLSALRSALPGGVVMVSAVLWCADFSQTGAPRQVSAPHQTSFWSSVETMTCSG